MAHHRYMLDTDTCSYTIKGANPAVLGRLRTTPPAEVCVSVITKAELLYGVEVSPRKQRDSLAVQAFLAHVEVLDLPGDAASHYAQIRADLKARGVTIGANDLFIGAHARSAGLVLVTNNTGHFSRVQDLTIENWSRSESTGSM